MRSLLILLVAAAALASCEKETLPEAEKTYNVTFKVYCDTCESYISYDYADDDILPWQSPTLVTIDSMTYDTTYASGAHVYLSCLDFDINTEIDYKVYIYVDDELVASALVNPDGEADVVISSISYYLE